MKPTMNLMSKPHNECKKNKHHSSCSRPYYKPLNSIKNGHQC